MNGLSLRVGSESRLTKIELNNRTAGAIPIEHLCGLIIQFIIN